MKIYEKIEGYADLSVEEKLAQLESFEETNSEDYVKQINDLKAETVKWKEASNKASSDASKYKKELQAKMSDEEKAKAEREESDRKTKEELEYYKRLQKGSSLEKHYLTLGYPEELAKQRAEARLDGNEDKENEIEKEFVEYLRKETDKKAMANQPSLTDGKPLSQQDIEAQEFNQLKKWAGL